MVLGALIDVGVSVDGLQAALASLNVEGFSLSFASGQRGGVAGTMALVDADEAALGAWGMGDFVRATRESSLQPRVVDRACKVFDRLGAAEAAVHGGSEGETKLHELGHVDTLVDVVGAVAGLEMLGIERLYCSPLPSGSGVVNTEHGLLPVPSPATAELFAMANAPVTPPPGNARDAGEMVTPTGAAIVTTLATFRQPVMQLDAVGYGLGSRDSPSYPNVLALWTGEEVDTQHGSELRLIETNLDDMSPELLAYAQERLFELGARDVWFTPIQMKKNRPATMLSALVPVGLESQAVKLVMRETSSLGVRVRPIARYEAEREVVQVDTTLGPVAVKLKRLEGANVGVSPEYEACRRIAVDRGLPLQDVYRIVQSEAADVLLS